MTDREKLIDLLNGVGSNVMQFPTDGFIAALADHLLANGVTFATDTNVGSKWIPHTLPPKEWRDENGELINYLIYMPLFGVDIGNYVEPMNGWLCLGLPCNVTHWMPLPVPPKEE